MVSKLSMLSRQAGQESKQASKQGNTAQRSNTKQSELSKHSEQAKLSKFPPTSRLASE